MDINLMIGGEDYSPSAVSRVAWRLWHTCTSVTVDEFFLLCKRFTEAETLLIGAEVSPRTLDEGVVLNHNCRISFPDWVDESEAIAYQWWIITDDTMIPVFDAFDLMDKLQAKEWQK